MIAEEKIINPEQPILITGATGFIGRAVIECLLARGFRNLRCFSRASKNLVELTQISERYNARIEVLKGNLLSREDCAAAVKEVAVIYHLAAGTGEKSFPDAFMNSVVTTRNLLDAAIAAGTLKRFVNISSFAVYSNRQKSVHDVFDETSPVEERTELRGDAYCFAKAKQDQLVTEYGQKYQIPWVIIRPGVVYGPGKKGITGRVGIGT